ncbi:hypothetical protein M092_2372 [Parabacteroides distasonis str. 3776 D15 iv]|uniref:Uncharacterized protein n=1 Tax=Parabacteroides distasonis str. 3776 D15 i TaxID=1339342 RepID=A0AB34L7S5_PARDI|nr:hypothetical protein [Parabacteroides distasonis]KDS35641.1 hypothetical protein M091_2074 [Parabacteroides distasonis str. 3776 D15 i]KDS70697.1 hypothetical protein M092_2372 [Parabacteroides distasonis str. 3776 D15 iv]UVR25883.1 hypothetical protein NXY22_21210 [Parabacteroides distasonis]
MNERNENSSGEFLGNIAEELGNISNMITEIKEAQLNCATTDDLNAIGKSVASDMLEYTVSLKNSAEECVEAVNENRDDICESISEFKDEIVKKIDDFTADPPVQIVDKTVRVEKSTIQWVAGLIFSVFSCLFCILHFFWQEGRIEQCHMSDVKYHYIMMHNGVTSEGIDSIESWFSDPKRAKIIEAEVRQYERRVQETARALQQKYRLEEKINELNFESEK